MHFQNRLLQKELTSFLSHLPISLYSSRRMEVDEEQTLLLKSSRLQGGVTQLQLLVQVVALC